METGEFTLRDAMAATALSHWRYPRRVRTRGAAGHNSGVPLTESGAARGTTVGSEYSVSPQTNSSTCGLSDWVGMPSTRFGLGF